MSRCFPFPPPGYEKKAVLEDVNLIIKEKKHKEKKHKDKKDKNKKEKSERKAKERSEGKHKEDKDRKQKKRTSKKDKKKDKQRSLEEEKAVGSLEDQNGKKLGPDIEPSNEIQDSRVLVELGKRVRDDGETGSHMVQKITVIEQRKGELPRKVEQNSGGMLADAYDNIKDKKQKSRISNGQSLKVESRGLENGTVWNFSGENQCKVELGKRVRDEGETGSQMVKKITFIEQRKGELPRKVEQNSGGMLAEAYDNINDKREQSRISNGQCLKVESRGLENGTIGNVSGGNQNQVELGKRVRDDGETGSPMVKKIIFIEQRNGESPKKVEQNSGGMLAEAYDNIKDKREQSRISNGQSLKVQSRGLENGKVGNLSGENQNKVEGRSCQVEKVEKKKERKEKNSHKSSGGKENGHKSKDRDKSSKAENKKRKTEKKEEKVKNKSKEQVKQRETVVDFPDDVDNKASNLLKENQGSSSKRKEPEMNGFPPVNGTMPGNMSRPASFSRQVSQNGSGFNSSELNLAVEKGDGITNHKVNGKPSSSQPAFKNIRNVEPGKTANNFRAENGSATINNHVVSYGLIPLQTLGIIRKVESSQTTSNVAKMEQGVINNCKVGVKVPPSLPVVENGRRVAAPIVDKVADRQESFSSHKMDNRGLGTNGVLDNKHTSLKPSSASLKAKKKVDISVKSPHPDSKYLSQILTVPKVEWPEFDDQDWLFSKDAHTKRTKVASSQIESTKQVWAEAIRMEYEDVTALPYVIPY